MYMYTIYIYIYMYMYTHKYVYICIHIHVHKQSDGVLVADVRSAESLFKYLVGEIEVVEVADEGT